MNIAKSFLLPVILFFVVFLLSYFLGEKYINGDQEHYIRVYSNISDYDFLDGFLYYRLSLSSSEFGHYTLIWLFSRFLDKIFFVSFFNSLLALFSFLVMRSLGAHSFICIVIILSNYYFYVLYFSAERLKFAFLFMLMAVYFYSRSRRTSYLMLFLSILTHAQIAIFYISSFIHNFLHEASRVFFLLRVKKSFLVFIFVFFLFSLVVGEYAINKFFVYFDKVEGLAFSKTVLFFLLTLIYKRSFSVILFYLVVVFFGLVLGDGRINIIAYFYFLYCAIGYRKGFNFGVAITTLYFIQATYFFVDNVVITGSGFPE